MPYPNLNPNPGADGSHSKAESTVMPSLFRTIRVAGAVAALCLCQLAAAGSAPRYGVLVFSNRCISAMSDDVEGNRITVHRFADRDTLVYEYDDGSAHAVLAHDVMIDTATGGMRFQVDVPGEPTATVFGAMTTDGRRVTLRGLPFAGDRAFTLLRVSDFGAPLRQCK
jgi:hypothetical protein